MANIDYLNSDGLLFFWQQIKTKLGAKVDKVEGKGLSTNDYTTLEKNKLAGIADSAQVNIIESIAVNGVTISPVGKKVSLTVSTKVSQLENDLKFQTDAQVASSIASAIGGLTTFHFEIVQSLPSIGESNVIYLVPKTASSQNVYDEYAWIENKWEKIGSTDIDLSGYVKFTDLVVITNAEIEAIINS